MRAHSGKFIRLRRSWKWRSERKGSVLPGGGDAAADGAALSGRINSGGIVAGKGKCYGVHRGFSMTLEKKSNSHCMAYR